MMRVYVVTGPSLVCHMGPDQASATQTFTPSFIGTGNLCPVVPRAHPV